MATKWKNTDDRSKWAAILERNRDLAALAGAVLMVVGGCLLFGCCSFSGMSYGMSWES